MNYIILFHDGGSKKITVEQYDAIIKTSATNKTKILVDNYYIAFSNIARIMPLEDYHKENPNKIPAPTQMLLKPKMDYMSQQDRLFRSEKFCKTALKIWKRQREEFKVKGEYREGKGIDLLIRKAELKLA